MKLLSDISPKEVRQSAIVYGGAKTGKTISVLRLAKKYKIILFDLEGGILSALNDSNLLPEYRKNISVISPKDTPTTPLAFTTTFECLTNKPVTLCNKHDAYGCKECKKEDSYIFDLFNIPLDTIVVIDSLSQLTTSALNYITRDKANTTKKRDISEGVTMQEWGVLSRAMYQMMTFIQAAPTNVICITHEESTTLEDGKVKLSPSCGSSSLTAVVGKFFDHVIYSEKKGNLLVLHSSSSNIFNAVVGSRTNAKTEVPIKELYTQLEQIYKHT